MSGMAWVYFNAWGDRLAIPLSNIISVEETFSVGSKRAIINGIKVRETFDEAIEKINQAYDKNFY